jgi:formylmethanofuran dehydrogenase subunit C
VTDLLTLTLRAKLPRHLDIDAMAPDRLAGRSAAEIAALPAWLPLGDRADATTVSASGSGRRTRGPALGDFFAVTGGGVPAGHAAGATVRIAGDLRNCDALGARLSGGSLIIDGDVGRDLGRGMTGGSIEVHGSAGDGVGRAMAGGTVSVSGRAGDSIGGPLPGGSRGMTGGEIVVRGDAGRDAGVCARRGLVVIGGDADSGAGRAMIAGTVVVMGRAAGPVGLWNKRGTVVALAGARIPETYRYACTYRPSFLRLLYGHLQRTWHLSIHDRFVTGRYARHCGDLSELGRGEVLTWVGA